MSKIYSKRRNAVEQGENSRWNKLKRNVPIKLEENKQKAKDKRPVKIDKQKPGRKPKDCQKNWVLGGKLKLLKLMT